MTACPRCGQQNPEGFRLCGMCGTALVTDAAPPGEERKVVSVLFVDLVGFTARSDQADPEDVKAILTPYRARVSREIERFAGTVEKFVGDAVMAAFGAPIAREDDAERAVRAALHIAEAIDELNAAAPELGLAVRAAVNTGEAVVDLDARPERGEGIVTGDVVNTASRLQQVAPVGGVVVGELTYRVTRDVIDYEELQPVAVKGKREPISVWRARGARPRVGVDVEPPARTPFIGRAYELVLLKEIYARAVQEASVQLVTVVGEPGVGKTRLLSEFRQSLDDQPGLSSWKQGRCLPYGEGITFWALGEIVKAQAGILESDSPERASEKLAAAVGAAVPELSEREWFVATLSPLVGASLPPRAARADRGESFTAWRRFLEAVASPRPLVVVLEDLHWADPALLEFVEHLVDRSSEVPLLVLCTARPELYRRRPDWGVEKPNATTVSLSPLSDVESARLLSVLLSQAALPADVQAALIERCGGNPLYAEEFVQMLTDRGILTRDGRVVNIAAAEAVPVPETLQALIAARIDALPPDGKALLHDAAVVGKVFWAGALSFMGGVDERTVVDTLRELVDTELVRPALASSVREETEYSFWHILVRDVAYSQIPRVPRARKHRAAAEWIERLAGERVTDHAELLAYHYAEALRLAQASRLADEVSELEAQTHRSLVMAGDRALRLDVSRAGSYYRRALDLQPAGSPGRAQVLVKAAQAAHYTGRYAEAAQNYEEAIAALRARKDAVAAGRAMVLLSELLRDQGRTADGRALDAKAVNVLETQPPGPELALAYAGTAGDRMLWGRFEECLEWSDKALALAEEFGIEDVITRVLQFRGCARCELGDLDGLDDLRQSLRRGLDLGLGRETGTAYVNLGDFVWLTEGPSAALSIHREGIDFSERRGFSHRAMWTKAETVWWLFDLGEWDEVLRLTDEVTQWEHAHGGSQMDALSLPFKIQVFLCRGEKETAALLARELLPVARDIADVQVLVPALTTAALVAKASDDHAAALRLIEEFRQVTEAPSRWRIQHVVDAVRVLAAAGEVRLARALIDRPEPAAARLRHSLLTSRAILAEAEGDLERASEQYAAVAKRWAAYGHVLEQGQALLGTGRCLLGLGCHAEGAVQLDEARKVFARLGAGPLLTDADAFLTQAAVSS